MTYMRHDRSVPEVLSDLLNQVTTLFRKESQLARTEISDKISQAAAGLGLVAAGAVLLMPALVILLQAAVAAIIDTGIEAHWAALAVGGAVLLIGCILLIVGMNRLKAQNLVPERTIHQLQEDASVAKRQIRQDHDHQRAA
jgi:hypothetical protein